MESVLIEYLRFDNLDTGILMGGKKYILAHKNLPVKEVETTTGHQELLTVLRECLRYDSALSVQEKWKKIVEISQLIRPLLSPALEKNYSNCQLDVVLNASELGLLPFELLLNEDQVPYFADPKNKLVFTRRIRQNYLETPFDWPVIPKVLFVYAHGGSKEVPFANQKYELEQALKKFGDTSSFRIFQMLDEATFTDFKNKMQENDKPDSYFTHVHILAHGKLIFDEDQPESFEYGIAFGKKGDPVTKTAAIKELFESLTHKPFLVNYMICDGANFINPMRVDKNPVQVTHQLGVPIVFGSQFPLSMDGSTIITKHLYSQLFEGKDIRNIIYDIRCQLFKYKDIHHDWISLAAYIRLPEGYEQYRKRNALVLQMQELKRIKSETDKYVNLEVLNPNDFGANSYSINKCITILTELLSELLENDPNSAEVLENYGLLGSSYKRIAELYFITGEINKTDTRNEQFDNLKLSLELYKKACDKNLSHHWSVVQYLSLDVVLHSRMTDMGYWHAAKTIVNTLIGQGNANGWTYGSLIELLLLAPKEVKQDKLEIIEAVDKLVEIAKREDFFYMIESTRYQINRYITWWTSQNGYHINQDLRIHDENLLLEILTKLV